MSGQFLVNDGKWWLNACKCIYDSWTVKYSMKMGERMKILQPAGHFRVAGCKQGAAAQWAELVLATEVANFHGQATIPFKKLNFSSWLVTGWWYSEFPHIFSAFTGEKQKSSYSPREHFQINWIQSQVLASDQSDQWRQTGDISPYKLNFKASDHKKPGFHQ